MPAVESVVAGESVVKVGDFFYSSWGYDQTNVDFYKVVGFSPSGKSVKLQKVNKSFAQQDGPHDSVMPSDVPATYKDYPGLTPEMDYWERQALAVDVPVKPFTKRLRTGGYKDASVSLNSYSSAYLWDGTPQYQTGAGYGH